MLLFHKYDILHCFILTQVVQCLFCCQETILLVMYTKSGQRRDNCYPSVLLNTQYHTHIKILRNLPNFIVIFHLKKALLVFQTLDNFLYKLLALSVYLL